MSSSLRESSLSVVTVANQKGGVGKTSSVIQIASGLAKRGEKVLMIDGDPQGNLSLFFGDKSERDFCALLSDLNTSEKVKLNNYVGKNVRRHLDLIPARNRNFRMDMHDSEVLEVSKKFSSFISSVRLHYDWIIIDSSPSNSPLERLLIRASDAVIIPLEFQLFSVAGLEAILEEVRSCSDACGKEISIHSLLFTKAENRLNRVNTYRQVFSTFNIPIFEICKSEYLSRSIEKSRTIWECGPASFAARDYTRVIEKGFLELQ
jgi:chromosome partitioning protein